MFKLKVYIWLLFSAPLSLAMAHASCGASSCPIDTRGAERTEKGMFRVDFSYEYINQDQPRIGRDKATVGEISGHHDEVSTLSETRRLGLEAGLSSRLSVEAVLPFVHREHQHIHNHMGTPILESWDFNGMGDMTLLARYAIIKPRNEHKPVVSLMAGAKLPTGRHHVTNADGDEAEPGILPGSGAAGEIAGISVSHIGQARTLNGLYAQLPVFFSSTYQWNEKGSEDYRIGNIWVANVGTVYPLFPRLGFITQVNMRVNDRDEKGSTHEEVQKTGGTYVYLTPGLQLGMNENLWSYAYVQLPVYQRVNSIQLTSDYNFLMGVSYRFSVL